MRGRREKKHRDTHTAMKANNRGKQGMQCICEKTLARANYTQCQFWMPGIKGKQRSFVGNGNRLKDTTRYKSMRQNTHNIKEPSENIFTLEVRMKIMHTLMQIKQHLCVQRLKILLLVYLEEDIILGMINPPETQLTNTHLTGLSSVLNPFLSISKKKIFWQLWSSGYYLHPALQGWELQIFEWSWISWLY